MEFDSSFWDTTWSRKYERYNRHHQLIWETIFPCLKGKIVDLGCGPCVMYEGKEVDLTGVDWSAEALNQARSHYSKGTYVQANAEDSGLPTGQYDTVLMMGLLDYFEDWTPVLTEARRLVKPGGRILGTLLNGFRGHDWTRYPHIYGEWHLVELTR